MTVMIGWLADQHEHPGGAELTQAEFRAGAPDDIHIVDCPPGAVVPGLDAYVIHNCTQYTLDDLAPTTPPGPLVKHASDLPAPLIKYVHDVMPHGDPALRHHLMQWARCVFCSQTHLRRFPWSPLSMRVIPPAVDLTPYREAARNTQREPGSVVWLGSMNNQGKGIDGVVDWAERNATTIDFYGDGPHAPRRSGYVRRHDPVPHHETPEVLARYERFIHLPWMLEPFGRSVAEAWAAGCELVTNHNVGALDWIRDDPHALDTGNERFWQLVREATNRRKALA